jgi:hypothetical protein
MLGGELVSRQSNGRDTIPVPQELAAELKALLG